MIFPYLKNKKFGYVNLDLEARKWIAGKKFASEKNPLLEPAICDEMVRDVNKKYSLDFSYGGWMEDRSFLWHGSYMDQKKTYVHLGADVNIPSGTEIMASFDAEVSKIDNDPSFDCGWGTWVILKYRSEPIYLIYAHLDKNVLCQTGDPIKKGQVFATVGKPPYNGNWFEHVHLQAITEEYYEEIEKNNLWNDFDGYGSERDIRINAKRFPDPIRFIF